jgi:hypothetical protein
VKSNGFLSKVANGWFMSSIVSIQSGQPFSPTIGVNWSNSGVLQGGQGDRPNMNTPALIAKYWNPATCTSQPGQPAAGSNPCPYVPIPYDASKVITGDPNNWINTAMFSLPPACFGPGLTNCSGASGQVGTIGQLGTAPRNSLTGPDERNWDFSLVKDTKLGFLGEAGMLEFRAEFFNVMNHPNFAGGMHFNTQIFSGTQSDSSIGNIGPFMEQPIPSRVNAEVQDGQREIQFALRLEF